MGDVWQTLSDYLVVVASEGIHLLAKHAHTFSCCRLSQHQQHPALRASAVRPSCVIESRFGIHCHGNLAWTEMS